jgi:hypothetical protein
LALSWTRLVRISNDVDPILLLCSAIAAQAAADERSSATCDVCGHPRCACASSFLARLRTFTPTDPLAIAVDMLRFAGA